MKYKVIILFLFIITPLLFVRASVTNGTIDSINNTALLCLDESCVSTSKINFKTTQGNSVNISDTSLTGNAWSETFGWINLNPTMGGVLNTQEGILSGYAWGELAGWINFKPTQGGVSINNDGEFVGYAWSENYGWIKFDCDTVNACVKTDWRPVSQRKTSSVGGSFFQQPINTPTQPLPIPEEIKIPNINNSLEENDSILESQTDDIPFVEKNEVPDENKDNIIENKDTKNNFSPLESPSTFVGFIKDTFWGSFDSVVQITNISIDKIKEIVLSPTGNIATKAVSSTGVLLGTYFGVTTVLFGNPITFGEIFLIPIRLWSLLMVAFGLKKRNTPWGTVYDSVTKQPLDPVYVSLVDLNGKEIASSITDLDGRYGFLVHPGIYKIIVGKTNYEFPSKKLIGQNNDEIYPDLYFGETVEVTSDNAVINKNIPMDPIKFDWNEFAKKDKKLMKFFSERNLWIARISNTLFLIGFLVALTAVIVSPVSYNIAIITLYLILFIFRQFVIKPKPFGNIKKIINDEPLSFAIIRVIFSETKQEVIHKVADKIGRYYCLVPNGSYYINIENKNDDGTYSLVYTSEQIIVNNGYINKKFKI